MGKAPAGRDLADDLRFAITEFQAGSRGLDQYAGIERATFKGGDSSCPSYRSKPGNLDIDIVPSGPYDVTIPSATYRPELDLSLNIRNLTLSSATSTLFLAAGRTLAIDTSAGARDQKPGKGTNSAQPHPAAARLRVRRLSARHFGYSR